MTNHPIATHASTSPLRDFKQQLMLTLVNKPPEKNLTHKYRLRRFKDSRRRPGRDVRDRRSGFGDKYQSDFSRWGERC